LKGCQYVPQVIITDKLASYGAAKQDVLPSVEHRQHQWLNNRAENAHQPMRQRERTLRRFQTPGHVQRFLSAFGPIRAHFCPQRHRLKASEYRQVRQERFCLWNEVPKLHITA
jgi:putative transposase